MPNWTAPLHEPSLARPVRRARGVYYTPAEVVRFIGEHTLQPLLTVEATAANPPRVLDPACGAGAFLVEAADRVLSVFQNADAAFDTAERLAIVRRSVFGIDIDRTAVQQARAQLAKVILASGTDEPAIARLAAELATNVIHADTLLDDLPTAFDPGSFDAIVGNPPYVNIRQLVKQQGLAYVTQLRKRYRTATGNFDLYVPFLERAWQLLSAGGRCAFILPNKIAGLGYAAECRRLLLERTCLDHIVDLSNSRVFSAAGVYPWIVSWRKQTPAPSHRVAWRLARKSEELAAFDFDARIDQGTLQADSFRIAASAPIQSEPRCHSLGSLATLECGTAGYTAQRIAGALVDAKDDAPNARSVDFIVSGNIDRYSIQLGDVRYLGTRYEQPKISLDHPALTARQRRLFAQPKIVVSGMTRRLEAAYHDRGLALGVQVYAVVPPAEDLYYVLGLLNSRWLSYWFRQQFAAKQLAGGYLGINKAQLTQLPIRVVCGADRADVRRRRAIAEAAEALSSQGNTLFLSATELDRRLDQVVYELYQLSDTQIAECESHFAKPSASTLRRAA